MPTPTRDQALETLAAGQRELGALFAKLSDQEMVRPRTISGGEWSAKDLLGHIAFWEELALQALADWRERRRPAVIALFEEGVDAANMRNQERTAARSIEDVRARATTAHQATVDAIRAITDEEWQSKPFYPDPHHPTLADLLGGVLGAPRRPFGHAFAHLPDLKRYVDSLSASN